MHGNALLQRLWLRLDVSLIDTIGALAMGARVRDFHHVPRRRRRRACTVRCVCRYRNTLEACAWCYQLRDFGRRRRQRARSCDPPPPTERHARHREGRVDRGGASPRAVANGRAVDSRRFRSAAAPDARRAGAPCVFPAAWQGLEATSERDRVCLGTRGKRAESPHSNRAPGPRSSTRKPARAAGAGRSERDVYRP